MKNTLYLFLILFSNIVISQVGINTTSPKEGSMLDINAPDKGIYIPLIDITDLSTIEPITGVTTPANAESLLVYNTNDTTGKGFYYWNRVKWVQIDGEDDWKLVGNIGTVPGIGAGQNYLGTQDDTNLVIARNATERLSLTSNEIVLNEIGDNYDVRIEGDNQQNLLFTDASVDRIGVNTNTPQTTLHVAGATSIVRIESLNGTNNVNNNGIDPSVVMVDTNGDLFLRSGVDDFPIDASDTGIGANTFMASPIALTSNDGALVSATAYTTSITLTRETLVEVVFWTAVSIVDKNGNYVTDGKPRLIGGWVVSGTTDIVYSAQTYTNHAPAGTVTIGYMTVGGNGFIKLPVGTHTITLQIWTGGGETITGDTDDAQGVIATFGANSFNRFQIIYHN